MATKNYEKARYWVGVLYPENMKESWQDDIGDILGLPYAYCLHHKDRDTQSEHRKDHMHLILAWNNTTTYNRAKSVFERLSAEGKQALNKIESVTSIRNMYEYLIHNTENCKKKGKERYSAKERITGNNFDIGLYEQVSQADKTRMTKELCDLIVEKEFTNFKVFYAYVSSNYGYEYFELLVTRSGLFERIIKGCYLERFQ